MGKFKEELVKAGVMLAEEGLHPSSKGNRLHISDGKKTLIDGSLRETKELVGHTRGNANRGVSGAFRSAPERS